MVGTQSDSSGNELEFVKFDIFIIFYAIVFEILMDLFHHFEREKKEKIEKLKYVRSIMFYENVIFVNVFESQLMLHFFGEKVKDLEKERFSYESFLFSRCHVKSSSVKYQWIFSRKLWSLTGIWLKNTKYFSYSYKDIIKCKVKCIFIW